MSDPRKTGSVYKLTDPRTGLIRYVGATVRPLRHRYLDHLRRSHSSAMVKWISDMDSDGSSPVLDLIACEPIPDLHRREREEIHRHILDGWPLLNVAQTPHSKHAMTYEVCVRRIERCAHAPEIVRATEEIMAQILNEPFDILTKMHILLGLGPCEIYGCEHVPVDLRPRLGDNLWTHVAMFQNSA